MQRTSPPPLRLEDWNEYEITANSREITVRLNQTLINTYRGFGNQAGKIALQGLHGTVQFRNVRIKELPPDAKCEIVSFAGHRYQLIEENMRWEEAKARAEQMGGHLATFTSREENDWAIRTFRTYLQNKYANILLGGFRNGRDSQWQWVTGEPFVFTDWNPGEPNHGGENACLHLWRPDANLELINWDDGWINLDRATVGFVVEWDDASKL
jgi:Domain of Unknown Function (DUF1080)/Lectin C-type domain